MPKFSLAFNCIRAKLERIFEPRPLKQQQHEADVLAVVDEQQQHQLEVVKVVAAPKPQGEIVYASLVFKPPQGPKREPVAADSGQQTATIRRPSTKKNQAPPPPTLSKPTLPFAGEAKGGTLPRPQKPPPAPPTSVASTQAASSAASSVALNQVATRRAPPPLPQRRSSLRSLNSLRRARSVPMEANFKLPVKFLNDYDLWDEDECFVSYV